MLLARAAGEKNISSQFLHNLTPNAAYVMDDNLRGPGRPEAPSFFSSHFWVDCICGAPGESHVKAVTALR